METKPEVHIENWARLVDVLTGNVTDHPRFKPGTLVYTSRVIRIEGNRAETQNTIYILGKPYEETAAETVEARKAA
jgi:hypothetical protein